MKKSAQRKPPLKQPTKITSKTAAKTVAANAPEYRILLDKVGLDPVVLKDFLRNSHNKATDTTKSHVVLTDVSGGQHGMVGRLTVDKKKKLELKTVLWARTLSGKETYQSILKMDLEPTNPADNEYKVGRISVFGKEFKPKNRAHLEELLATTGTMMKSVSKRHFPDPSEISKLYQLNHDEKNPFAQIFPGILLNGTISFKFDTNKPKRFKVLEESLPAMLGYHDKRSNVKHTVSFFDPEEQRDKNFSFEVRKDRDRHIHYHLYGWEQIGDEKKAFTLAKASFKPSVDHQSEDEISNKGIRYEVDKLFFNGKQQSTKDLPINSRIFKVIAKASNDIIGHKVPDWQHLIRRYDLGNIKDPLESLTANKADIATYYRPLGGNNTNAPLPFMRSIGGNAHLFISPSDEKNGAPTKIQIDDGMFLTNKKKTGYDSVIVHPIEDLDALIFTHAHADHIGGFADKFVAGYYRNTQIYADPVTYEMLRIQLQNAGMLVDDIDTQANFKIFRQKKKFKVGNFELTPYLTDHSAQAYSFHIHDKKSDIRVNFHSDTRDAFMQNKADLTVIEGTYADVPDKPIIKEQQTLESLQEILKNHKDEHVLVAQTSGQHSRLLTLCEAAGPLNMPVIVTGKTLVDMYNALDRGGIYDPEAAKEMLEYHEMNPPSGEPPLDRYTTDTDERLRACSDTLHSLAKRKHDAYERKIKALKNGYVPLRQYAMYKFGTRIYSHQHKQSHEVKAAMSGGYIEAFAGTQGEMNTRLEKETSQTAKDLYDPKISMIIVAQTPFHKGNEFEYTRQVYSLSALGFATYHPLNQDEDKRLIHASGHISAAQLIEQVKQNPQHVNYVTTHAPNIAKAAELIEGVNAVDGGHRVVHRLDNGNTLKMTKNKGGKTTIKMVGYGHPGFQGLSVLRPDGKYWPAPADPYYEQNNFSFGYNYAGTFMKASDRYLESKKRFDKMSLPDRLKHNLFEPRIKVMQAALDDFKPATYDDTVQVLKKQGFGFIAAYDFETTDKSPNAFIRSVSIRGTDLENNPTTNHRFVQAIPQDQIVSFPAWRIVGGKIADYGNGLEPRLFDYEIENAFKAVKKNEKGKSNKLLLVGYNNKHFDKKVLQTARYRAGYTNMSMNQGSYSQEWDTYQLALMYFSAKNIPLPNYKLGTVAQQLNVKVNGKPFDPNNAHDDDYDTQATREIFETIRHEAPEIFNYWAENVASKNSMQKYLLGHGKGFDSPRPIVTVCKMEKVIDAEGKTTGYRPTYKLATLVCLDLDNGASRNALLFDISSPKGDYNKLVEYAKMTPDELIEVMKDKSPDNPFLRVDMDEAIILPGTVGQKMGLVPNMPVHHMNAIKDVWYSNKAATDNAQTAFQQMLRYKRENADKKIGVEYHMWDKHSNRYDELDYKHDREIAKRWLRPSSTKKYNFEEKESVEFRYVGDAHDELEALPAGHPQRKRYYKHLAYLEREVFKTPRYRMMAANIVYNNYPEYLQPGTLQKMNEYRHINLYGDSLHPGVVPWPTIPSERQKMEEALAEGSISAKEAKTYEKYLQQKEKMFPKIKVHQADSEVRETVATEVRKQSYRHTNQNYVPGT